jgi:hypothetical protein
VGLPVVLHFISEKFIIYSFASQNIFMPVAGIDFKPVFDVHVTMHCDKFLKIKPMRCTNFSNLFLE